jgi:hypothetical protein
VETIKWANEVNTRFQLIGWALLPPAVGNADSPVWTVLAPGGFWLARCLFSNQSPFACGWDWRHRFSQFRRQFFNSHRRGPARYAGRVNYHSARPSAARRLRFAFAPFRVSLNHNPALPSV